MIRRFRFEERRGEGREAFFAFQKKHSLRKELPANSTPGQLFRVDPVSRLTKIN